MKFARTIVVATAMLILAACGGGVTKVNGVVINSDTSTYYDARMAYFATHPAEPGKPMMIGDSITEGWQVQPSWPAGWTNRGISGDNTSGVVRRLDAHLAEKPSEIILLIGTNNYMNGADDFEGDVDTIIAKTSAANVPLIVISILPTSDADHNDAVDSFNAYYKAACGRYSLRFVNIHDAFETDGKLNNALFTDGLHPNAAGYNQMGTLFTENNVE